MEQTIAVISDVKNLSERLAGATLGTAQLLFSGGRLHMELDLLRPAPQAVRGRGAGLSVKSRLTLERITAASVQHVSTVPTEQPLLSCEAVPGGYQVVVATPDGLRLELTVEQLSGRLTSSHEVG